MTTLNHNHHHHQTNDTGHSDDDVVDDGDDTTKTTNNSTMMVVTEDPSTQRPLRFGDLVRVSELYVGWCVVCVCVLVVGYLYGGYVGYFCGDLY